MIKLINGDCLEVMQEIESQSIDMILCDPPYGTTVNKWDKIINFKDLWCEYERIIKPNGVIAIFGAEPFASLLRCSNLKLYRYDWVWDKGRGTDFLNAKRKPMASYETISIFYKKLPTYNPQYWFDKPYHIKNRATHKTINCYGESKTPKVGVSLDGRRYPLNVIKINSKKRFKSHPTQKPVELLEYLIKTYTNEGETVLDNCTGSGSTGVACVNTNRDFIGIELDKNYFEIAEKRIKEAKR